MLVGRWLARQVIKWLLRARRYLPKMHDVDGDQSAWSEEASTARQTRRAGRIHNAVDTTIDKDMGLERDEIRDEARLLDSIGRPAPLSSS